MSGKALRVLITGKKSLEEFRKHEVSQCHRESILKMSQRNKASE